MEYEFFSVDLACEAIPRFIQYEIVKGINERLFNWPDSSLEKSCTEIP